MPILALLGLGMLLLLAKGGRSGRPATSGEVPIGPDADKFEVLQGGILAYKRAVAIELIRGLRAQVVSPTPQDNVLVVLPGPGGDVGPDAYGAYWGLQAVHDQGYALYVPLSFHYPQARTTGQFVVYLPEGEAPPPDYALLIAPGEVWPTLR